jgi:3-deoxy-D-manno-octulosonic-acid transferase
MSERWARTMLSAYRLAGSAAYPLIGGYVNWRAAKGKEERSRRHERYGYASIPRPEGGPLVWVHAASVGESMAVVPLVTHFHALGLNVVMTTGTVTSAQVVADRLAGMAIHQYVPLDLRPAVSRFLEHWRPDLAVIAESEIWPMTILELGAKRIPQVLVNGRLSDRSFNSWRRIPRVSEALFENLAHVVAQSEQDGERFRLLGARPVTVSGNLKVDMEIPPYPAEALSVLRRQIGQRPNWAAISTHPGEELLAARIHLQLRKRMLDLLTIIVPRHPERADAIHSQLNAMGLVVARRSFQDPVTPDTDILLGDTIGEMGLYLRLTEIAFVGRSMVPNGGGQNPLEPAVLDTAIIAGQAVHNFRETYDMLLEGGGARLVPDARTLCATVFELLQDRDERQRMILAGRATMDQMRGALRRTLKALEPYVQPLVVKARLERDQQVPGKT